MNVHLSNFEKYLVAFVVESPVFYLKTYRHKLETGEFTFNIPAFFLGMFWFLYRKMYVQAAVIFAIISVIGVVEDLMLVNASANGLASMIVNIVVTLITSLITGFVANNLYIAHAEKKINQITATIKDEESVLKELKKKGGTNLLIPWIAAGIFLVVFVLTR
jgi:hypothetical protein